MNRRVLIISPHFPPINAPDHQRVRMSLPYFAEFGWIPYILGVDPKYVEGVIEPLLEETIPQAVKVQSVKALPVRWTRKVGLGSLALRAFPYLYMAGARVIKEQKIDIVYFSTTAFPVMVLGQLWKNRFGVPYVLDMQDPWLSDYYKNKPKALRPPKYWFAHRLNQLLEPWTMRRVDALIAVSDAYTDTLRRRYPWITPGMCTTLPFGASDQDFKILKEHMPKNTYFQAEDGHLHGVYVGRVGHAMATALRIIFGALRLGLEKSPDLFGKVRLYFIGTDYATGDRAQKTVEPIAVEYDVGEYVEEYPHRILYFDTLRMLCHADFLIVPGSDDPQYTASKIYPYILARKPLMAVFHRQSNVVNLLRTTKAGSVVEFAESQNLGDKIIELYQIWKDILERLPFSPETDWKAFEPYTAREMTRKQCAVFDNILQDLKA